VNDWFEKATYQVMGAVISGFVGIVVFWFKRRWEAKDHFRITMSQIGGEFKKPCSPIEFYDATMPRLEEAVFRLRPFLKKSDADCLSTLWNLYRSMDSELHKSEVGRMSEVFDEAFPKHSGRLPKDKREIIEFFHKKFAEIAK